MTKIPLILPRGEMPSIDPIRVGSCLMRASRSWISRKRSKRCASHRRIRTASARRCVQVLSSFVPRRPHNDRGGLGIPTEPLRGLDGHTIDTLIVPGACDVDDVRRDRRLIDSVRDRLSDVARLLPIGSSCWQKPGCSNGRRG